MYQQKMKLPDFIKGCLQVLPTTFRIRHVYNQKRRRSSTYPEDMYKKIQSISDRSGLVVDHLK